MTNAPTARQRARAEAQRVMDQETLAGVGTRACALVALDDHFDHLAKGLLDRLATEAGIGDDEVLVARQIVDWRLGGEDLLLDAEGLIGRSGDMGWRLLDAALDCALPDVAVRLARCLNTRPPHLESRQRLLDELGGLDEQQAVNPACNVILARLPDGRSLEVAIRDGSWTGAWGALVSAAGSEVQERAGRWAVLPRWLFRRRPIERLSHVDFAQAWSGRSVSAGGRPVLISSGCLDRFTARHWRDALNQWPTVVVWGLVVHDPGAGAVGGVTEALRKHEPIGVADLCSLLVLREWGVAAVVLKPEGGETHTSRRQALWRQVPEGCRAESDWSDVAGEALRFEALDAESWRRLWTEFASTATHSRHEHWTLPPASLHRQSLSGVLGRRVSRGAGSGRCVELALTVDGALANELPVVVDSVLTHATLPVRCHVLTRDIAPEQLADWTSLFDGRAEMIQYPMDAVRIGGRPNLLSHTSESTLDRLMLPWVLGDLDKVLYLDVDLVVVGDIAPLWSTELGDRPLAAKPSSSPGMRWGLQMLYHALQALPFEQACLIRQWLHDDGPMGFRAFNAGVLLMNLDQFRRDGAVERLLALVEHCAMNDQDALNAYTRGRYLALPDEWNAAPRQDLTDGAKIIHFVGPVKPWHELYVSRKPDYLAAKSTLEQRRRQ